MHLPFVLQYAGRGSVAGQGVLQRRHLGHTPSTAGTFRKKFRKNSGKTPETLSERFLEFRSRVRLGCPKPYNSGHLRLPERFQNSLPPSTAGDASFSRISSGEGLSELVMEFPAVLGVFLSIDPHTFFCMPLRVPPTHTYSRRDLPLQLSSNLEAYRLLSS